MSLPGSAPLRLTPGSSPALALWIVAAHGAALATLTMFTEAATALPVVVAVAVVLNAINDLRTHVLRNAPQAIIEAVMLEGGWLIVFRDGVEMRARTMDAFIHPRLTIVGLEADGGQRMKLVLAYDALSSIDHRRLRVGLAYHGDRGDQIA